MNKSTLCFIFLHSFDLYTSSDSIQHLLPQCQFILCTGIFWRNRGILTPNAVRSVMRRNEVFMQTTLPITNENGYFEIRLESIGGLGANLCGKMLGELGALFLDLNASSFSSYGSEKRGSPVKAFIRWCGGDKPVRINSPVVSPHILAIFHEGLLSTYPVLDGVTQDTRIILATSLSEKEAKRAITLQPEPFSVWMPLRLPWRQNPASTWSCSAPSPVSAALYRLMWQKHSAGTPSGKNILL